MDAPSKLIFSLVEPRGAGHLPAGRSHGPEVSRRGRSFSPRAKDALGRGDAQRNAHAVDIVNGYAVRQLNDEGAAWREEQWQKSSGPAQRPACCPAALEESRHAAVTWRGDGKCFWTGPEC